MKDTNLQPKTQPAHHTAWKLLAFNARAFVVFETLYKLIGALAVMPLLLWLLRGMIKLAGFDYVAAHNLKALLTNPVIWLWVVIFIVAASFYALVDISACIIMCEMSRRGEKASVRAVAKAAGAKASQVVRKRNLPFIIFVLLVLPLTNVVIAPSFLSVITIPDFIVTFIMYSWVLIAAVIVVSILLVVFAVKAMYALHYYVLEGDSWATAFRKSRVLGRKHNVRDVLYCLVRQLLYGVAAIAIAAVLLGALYLLGVLFQHSGALSQVAETVISSFLLVAVAIMAIVIITCSTPLCYALVSARYYRHKHNLGENVDEDVIVNAAELRAKPSKALKVTTIIAGVACVAIASVAVTIYYSGNVNAQKSMGNVDIVAHRCGANYAPENTIAALNKAADMGVEWCEIDAQQLADGTIVVMHDSNFARVGGLDSNTWETTYDQMKDLDAGSTFSSEYAGEHIPLLRDMILAAKARGMKLQIEIKPTGHDEGIEQRVVDIVRELNFQDSCMVASMNYDCLQKIRACASDVKVLYIMSVAFGDIASIPEADSYSVESTWTTAELAENVHSKDGATLCAWTVNSEDYMTRCISNGVDSLVTDDVVLAREVVSETNQNESLLIDVLNAFRKNG